MVVPLVVEVYDPSLLSSAFILDYEHARSRGCMRHLHCQTWVMMPSPSLLV